MSKNAVINALKKNKSFLVVTHVNPDGDALGCQLALGKILKRLKKLFICMPKALLLQCITFYLILIG